MTDLFQRAFDTSFKRPRDITKRSLSVYHSFIGPFCVEGNLSQALDLGCGNGEWLEILRQVGFDALGVDTNEDSLTVCKAYGLHAIHQDALEALKQRANDSIDLISAFQLLEYLPFGKVRELISEALRVLRPGGILILETVNPENILMGSYDFYIDPTRLRPLPFPLLSLVTQFSGFFRSVKMELPLSKSVEHPPQLELRDVLSGLPSHYGLVAQKEADPQVLNLWGQSFNQKEGCSVIQLAEQYQQQLDHKMQQYQQQLDHKMQSQNLNYEAQLLAVYSSKSWRVTAPLRWVMVHLVPIRQYQVIPHLKQAIKNVAFKVAPRINALTRRSPTLNRFCKKLFTRFQRSSNPFPVASPAFENLSERGQQIYSQMTQSIKFNMEKD